jgi:DNA modification methylase
MFVFSKRVPKTINLIKDKKNIWFGDVRCNRTERQKDGSLNTKLRYATKEYSVRQNIWEYNIGYFKTTLDKDAYKHPAMFPEELVKDHIISWSNENDIVADPFMGSGTTAKMAILTNRNFIGFEISKEYCELANKRIEPYLLQGRLF